MKNRYVTLIVSMLLVCTIVVTGCSTGQQAQGKGAKAVEVVPMEPEESHAVSYDFIGGKDVMPIAGYYGPYAGNWSQDGNALPDFMSDEYFEALSESGLNLIIYSPTDYQTAPEEIEKMLESASNNNVGVYVRDSNVIGKKQDETISFEEAATYMSEYSEYPAFCGLYLQDEPNTPYYMPGDGHKDMELFPELGDLLSNQLDVPFYVNGYPMVQGREQEDWRKYLDEFFETFQPKVLSCTNYLFGNQITQPRDEGENVENYFEGLSVLREYAQKYEIPFATWVTAGSQFNDDQHHMDSATPYWPNEAEFRWNANVGLAYGAQQLSCFLAIQPYHFAYAESELMDSCRNGIIGVMGNKNQWFYYMQNLSKQIGAIDEVLMNSVNKGVIVSGEQAKQDNSRSDCIIESGTFQELQSVNGDTMVGCFNYNGKTALYVVNYSYEYAQKITLEFNKAYDIDVVQEAEKSYVNAQSLTLDMAAGEGVLLVIQ